MGRSRSRLPSFCLNRVATRVKIRSPPAESRPPSPGASKTGEPPCGDADEEEKADGEKEAELGRRIMIVVDSSPEAKAALQWALSHSVQSGDTVVLVQIVKPSRHGERIQREEHPRGFELLHNLKNNCQARKPEVRKFDPVQVELRRIEGKERGPAIVEEARKQRAALLVMGQKKRSVTWRLVMMWAGNTVAGGDTVDYCIQNATCMALAVRRKGRRGRGYLITTKRHRDFWLLA